MFKVVIYSNKKKLFCCIVKNCESQAQAFPIRSRYRIHRHDFTSTTQFIHFPLFCEKQPINVTISISCFSLSKQSLSNRASNLASGFSLCISTFGRFNFLAFLQFRGLHLNRGSSYLWDFHGLGLNGKILSYCSIQNSSLSCRLGCYDIDLGFRSWIKVEVLLDTDFVLWWRAGHLGISLGIIWEVALLVVRVLLIAIILSVPLGIWICPRTIIVIKYSRPILRMHWRRLLVRLHAMLMVAEITVTGNVTAWMMRRMMVMAARTWELLAQECFSFLSRSLPFLLSTFKHHSLLLLQSREHVPLLINLLLLNQFDSILNFDHFPLLDLLPHLLQLFI